MFRMKHTLSGAMAMVAAAVSVQASGGDIRLQPGLLQGDFNTLIDEMSVVTAYHSVAPAAAPGIVDLDIGASFSSYNIDRGVWGRAAQDGSAPSRLNMMRLHARKGLPQGFDIGVTYSQGSNNDIGALGGEVRKSLVDGSAIAPVVTISGHYSTLVGVDDIDLTTYGVDLGISKGFLMLTPFAGIGQFWYDGSDNTELDLSSRDSSQTRSYLGVRMGLLPFMSVTAQADFSEISSYSLRLNLGF